MTVVLGGAADVAFTRISWLGAFGETAQNAIAIDGAVSDADAEQFITDMDAVSAAGMPKASLNSQRTFTGQSLTPLSNTATAQVNNMLALVFTQPHPLNAALTVSKTVQVRAPVSTVLGTNGALVVASVVGDRSTADKSLRGIINFLQDNLVYEAIDGSLTVGGWTWDSAASAYVSAPAVQDGH